MKNFLPTLVLIALFLHNITTSHVINHSYPEISDDELAKFQEKFVIEEDESEKKYLEPLIKPEKFDLNKDRKISREEIKMSLIYIFYPKDSKKKKTIPKYLDEHLKNNIDVFAKSIKKDFLSYKQFQYLIRNISVQQFLSAESLESRNKAENESKFEGESEL